MRDKVKRFISILMTALMLVNLMPVGALADGITSGGYKQETVANHAQTVYVYAQFAGNPLPGLTLNGSQWYTIGYINDVSLPSPRSWGSPHNLYNGNENCGDTLEGNKAQEIISRVEHEHNTSIPIKDTSKW